MPALQVIDIQTYFIPSSFLHVTDRIYSLRRTLAPLALCKCYTFRGCLHAMAHLLRFGGVDLNKTWACKCSQLSLAPCWWIWGMQREGIQLLGSSFLFKYNCTEKYASAFSLSVLFLLSNKDGSLGDAVFSSFSLLAAQATIEAECHLKGSCFLHDGVTRSSSCQSKLDHWG